MTLIYYDFISKDKKQVNNKKYIQEKNYVQLEQAESTNRIIM